MLPDTFSNEIYWAEIYPRPLETWAPVLDLIAQEHHLHSSWTRARLGRNVVFLNGEVVLKLSPPGWKEDIARETAALKHVAGKLPVETPVLIATGEFEQWGYQIQQRLPGQNLHELWQGLPAPQRQRLAAQHAEILTALQQIDLTPVEETALRFDWQALLAEQRQVCQQEMAAAGIRAELVSQVNDYLEGAAALLVTSSRPVLLHGDLDHVNLLVQGGDAGWRITSLIDWGDAKMGPRGHELISPGVHMYLGDREAISVFQQGCARGNPVELMARAMLYYAGEFASFLKRIPGAEQCRTWDCIAQLMW
jgi:hygromycin-B 7''-O-kinase